MESYKNKLSVQMYVKYIFNWKTDGEKSYKHTGVGEIKNKKVTN